MSGWGQAGVRGLGWARAPPRPHATGPSSPPVVIARCDRTHRARCINLHHSATPSTRHATTGNAQSFATARLLRLTLPPSSHPQASALPSSDQHTTLHRRLASRPLGRRRLLGRRVSRRRVERDDLRLLLARRARGRRLCSRRRFRSRFLGRGRGLLLRGTAHDEAVREIVSVERKTCMDREGGRG